LLRSISIGKRVIALLALLILFIICTCGAFLYNTEVIRTVSTDTAGRLMLDGDKAKIRTTTDSLALALGQLIADAPDRETKIDMLRKALGDIRFESDKSGYFFVLEGTTIVAHAANPNLHDRDLGNTKDKNGVFLMRDLFKAARKGGGFVEYIWPKPGAGDQPKLSYATMIPGTQCALGTGKYIDNIKAEQAKVSNEIEAIVTNNTMIVGISLTAALLLIILPLSIFVVRSITKPIAEATDAADTIAKGDYDVSLKVQGHDEAAQLQGSLNAMAATLRDNIEEITSKTQEAEEKARTAELAMAEADQARAEAERARKEGIRQAAEHIQVVVDRVSSASEQIAAQSKIIDQGTTIQRERVQGAATAMEEMNATVLEVARNASEASASSDEAKEQAVDGAEIVSRSVDAMNTTYEAADGLKSGMNRLGEQADDIGKVMNVITDIADQTNLLALNAAIEAARAGEAGRGFAVVADEVRKLAEKTMLATKEVGASISAVQTVAQQNIDNMENALVDLSTATDLSNKSGAVLKDIVDGAESSALQIQSIATAAEEQSAASEEINRAIDEINSITMETSQGVAESADALQELASQMGDLQGVINKLLEDTKD